jgi:predicted anti-sigma-YlaC factor YlaD
MTQARQINCGQARRLLHKQLDGTVTPPEDTLLQAHGQRCPACAEHAAQLVAALQALRCAPAPEPRAPLAARIRAAAAQALRETPAPAPRLRLAPSWTAAAVAAAALLIVAFTFHGPGTVTPGPSSLGSPARVAVAPPAVSSVLPEPTSPATVAPAAPPLRVAVVAPQSAPTARSYHVEEVSLPYAPPAPAQSAPHSAYARARATMADTAAAQPQDTTEPAAPEADRVARVGEDVHVDETETTSESGHSGDFANEVVGGLVADAVLSTYLEGAPANVKITPAVLTTESSE